MSALDEGGLDIEPVYLAMTRQPMLMGVPFGAVGLASIGCSLIFIMSSHFGALLAYPLLHGVAYTMVQRDERCFDVWRVWSARCAKSATRFRFGRNVYFGS